MDIGSWVPQVFYDLIGRVVPGAFLLALGGLLFTDPVSSRDLAFFVFKEAGVPATLVLLAVLLVAYVVGTLLGAIGFAFWHREWTAKELSKIRVELPELPGPYKTGTGFPFMYDSILVHAPAAGARAVKLRAEQHMCRVLIVGTAMLFVAYCSTHWPPWELSRDLGIVGVLALIAVAAYLFHVHLDLRTRWLLVNYWYLLGEPTRVEQRKEGGT